MGRERARRALTGAAPFLFLLGLILILARDQAVATTGPWFLESETEAVYAVSLVMGTILVISMAVEGLDRWWALDGKIQSFELRLAVVRSGLQEAGVPTSRQTLAASATAPNPHRTGIIAASEGETQGSVAHPSVSDGDLPVLASPKSDNGPESDPSPDRDGRPLRSLESLEAEAKALATAQDVIAEARDAIWPTLTGPLLAGIGLIAIAGAMLPGSGSFLAGNFRLNTMFILFLSYTWWLDIGWFVFALASLRRRVRRTSLPS